LFLSNCSEDSSNIIEPFTDNNVEDANLKITGTVVYYTLEGGFYAVVEKSSKVYEPTYLPERFEVDGLEVYVEAKLRTDLGTRRQVGEVIQIKSIKQK